MVLPAGLVVAMPPLAGTPENLTPWQEVRLHIARMGITTGALMAAQVVLGEHDVPLVAERAVAFAVIAEGAALAYRWAARSVGAPPATEPTLPAGMPYARSVLRSYGR